MPALFNDFHRVTPINYYLPDSIITEISHLNALRTYFSPYNINNPG
jgi:hypothetical protein